MAKQRVQPSIFDMDDLIKGKEEWKGMPEFVNKDDSASKSIIVHFETKEDMEAFSKLIGQNITLRTKSIWYPKYDRDKPSNYIYIQENENE